MAQVGTRSVPIPSSSAATGAMPGGTCSSSPEGGSFARSSGGAGMPGSLQEQLQLLKLSAQNPDTLQTLDRVMQALRDVITGPGVLASSMSEEEEARWWSCFADVFEKEVATQIKESGAKELSLNAKRQILADILVWAEVTQDHYDQNTLQFVLQPHSGDESFQRIGQAFQRLKKERGLAGH